MRLLTADYAVPSTFDATRSRALLALSADARRPLRFRARIRKEITLLRMALRALGEVACGDSSGPLAETAPRPIDPIASVLPDRLIFEAFTQDASGYARLDLDLALFEMLEPPAHGTSSVDFSGWLWSALEALRCSRETELRIDSAAAAKTKVTLGTTGRELPAAWIRAAIDLQAAMTLPRTRLDLRPVDLLTATRFLRYANAKGRPCALRFELDPQCDARMVLEPWEQIVALRGARHQATQPRTIRTFGRQRLALLEPLLPYATRACVHLAGRALPSFYDLELPGIRFVLGVSGPSSSRWQSSLALALQRTGPAPNPDALARCLQLLAERSALDAAQVAAALKTQPEDAAVLLDHLVHQGHALIDLDTRCYRYRELYQPPLNQDAVRPENATLDQAVTYVRSGQVQLVDCNPEERRSLRRLRIPQGRVARELIERDWSARAAVADQPEVQVVLSPAGRIVFGECGCDWYRQHLLNRGPCAHMMALGYTLNVSLTDPPSSRPAGDLPAAPMRAPGGRAVGDRQRRHAIDIDKQDDDSDKAR